MCVSYFAAVAQPVARAACPATTCSFIGVSTITALCHAQTVYEEMEVDAEMQRGLLPGGLALSAKFVPALRSVAYRTVEVTYQLQPAHSKATRAWTRWYTARGCVRHHRRVWSTQHVLHCAGHVLKGVGGRD